MHTKEPWRVSGTNHLVGANGKVIPYDELKEDAHRIVACVNACAGMIDPEAHIKHIESASEYKAQRDELIAALKAISDPLVVESHGDPSVLRAYAMAALYRLGA